VPRGGADRYKDAVFYEVHVKASWTQTATPSATLRDWRARFLRDLGVDCL
jgi:hypothetical protein